MCAAEKTICFNGVLEMHVLNLDSTLDGLQGLKNLFELDTACFTKNPNKAKMQVRFELILQLFGVLVKGVCSTPAGESLNTGFSRGLWWTWVPLDEPVSPWHTHNKYSLGEEGSILAPAEGAQEILLHGQFYHQFPLRQKTPSRHGGRAVTASGASDAAP